MINPNIKNHIAVQMLDNIDSTDLLGAADFIAAQKIKIVFANAEQISDLWTWLEKSDVRIISKYDNFDFKQSVSELSERINSAFKAGASGAVIKISLHNLDSIVADFASVHDDLFFNRDLIVGFNLSQINAMDWDFVFTTLRKIHPAGICFDVFDDDVVGRVYGLLNSLDFDGDLYFASDNAAQIEQILRLTHKVRNDVIHRIKFLISPSADILIC